MFLHIVTLCLAVYTSPTAQVPAMRVCAPFPAHVYDTRLCPGEVTTNRRGDVVTCEVEAK